MNMKIHVAARRAIAAVALAASAVAVGSSATANAVPAPLPLDKPGPISFCSVFGGELPIIGPLPYCQKKTPEKMAVPESPQIPPITVPIEREG
jgi:hypothetical protein